jgi:hypothetical protein
MNLLFYLVVFIASTMIAWWSGSKAWEEIMEKNKEKSGDLQIQSEGEGGAHLKNVEATTGDVIEGSSGNLTIVNNGQGPLTIEGGSFRTGDVGPKQQKPKI